MESGLTMAIHSAIIAIIAYLLMFYVLNQSGPVAEDRSALLGGAALVYMVLFGHGMPGKINKNIM
jgi:hypothetical protein